MKASAPNNGSDTRLLLVPHTAPEAAKLAGTAFALKVSLSSEYGWHEYMADLWSVMHEAAMHLPPCGEGMTSVPPGETQTQEGKTGGDYEVLATLYDGTKILAPKTKSDRFTTEEIRSQIEKHFAAAAQAQEGGR